MSGFALAFDYQEPLTAQDHAYTALKEGVVRYKQLESTCHETTGRRCLAGKFDTDTTLHRGVTIDDQTGSWLLAMGAILDSDNGSGNANLQSLLNRYLQHGKDAVQDLDGAFALVIYDKLADRLAIISDPLGFVSIFYANQGKRVYVATSALAIAETIQAAPSEYGMYLFLTTGNVYGRSTLWQEVNRLPAGTVLELTPTGSSESVYWSPVVKDEINRLSMTKTVDHAIDLLSHSIMNCVNREEMTWADLTGGFDSRLVTALLHNCGIPFQATCEGPTTSPDVRISSQIARELGWAYQHNKLPDDWGRERYERLPQALGKGDGHYDVFKLSGVIWDQNQRARELSTSFCGLGGELWRGFFWKQELLNVGRSPTIDYDRLVDFRILHPIDSSVFNDTNRIKWIREELKLLLKSVGDRYGDSPNTLKLDCIYAFKNTGHTGAHISSVIGKQRVVVPLFLKNTMTFAISAHFRWRNHSRLVRQIIEKVNPRLANFETTSGGPATPIRASNFIRFVPYWSAIGTQLLRKVSRSVFGPNIWPVARSKFSDYPLQQWRQNTLNYLEGDCILDYTQMRSGRLYNPQRLMAFFEDARSEQFGQEAFLSRILTIELAMRAVGASL